MTFAESYAPDWMKWYEESVVRGNYQETTGVITYIASDGSELTHLELAGVGILGVENRAL